MGGRATAQKVTHRRVHRSALLRMFNSILYQYLLHVQKRVVSIKGWDLVSRRSPRITVRCRPSPRVLRTACSSVSIPYAASVLSSSRSEVVGVSLRLQSIANGSFARLGQLDGLKKNPERTEGPSA